MGDAGGGPHVRGGRLVRVGDRKAISQRGCNPRRADWFPTLPRDFSLAQAFQTRWRPVGARSHGGGGA